MTIEENIEFRLLLAFERDKLAVPRSFEEWSFQMGACPHQNTILLRGCFLCEWMVELEWYGCGGLCCTAFCGLTGKSVRFGGSPYKGCSARWPPEEDWEKML